MEPERPKETIERGGQQKEVEKGYSELNVKFPDGKTRPVFFRIFPYSVPMPFCDPHRERRVRQG